MAEITESNRAEEAPGVLIARSWATVEDGAVPTASDENRETHLSAVQYLRNFGRPATEMPRLNPPDADVFVRNNYFLHAREVRGNISPEEKARHISQSATPAQVLLNALVSVDPITDPVIKEAVYTQLEAYDALRRNRQDTGPQVIDDRSAIEVVTQNLQDFLDRHHGTMYEFLSEQCVALGRVAITEAARADGA